jgi:biopolymer transport protein TolR
MAMQLGGKGVKSDINVTPFVDIVLVLLIIFMVVTPMLSRALDVAVPPKSQDTTVTEAATTDQLILTVKGPDTSPHLFLNREEIPNGIDGLKDRVGELMKNRRGADKVVFFQADNELSYSYVVQVMDGLRGAGVEKIGLITDENLDVSQAAGGM